MGTSHIFLWDYDSSVMQYLRIPEKQPDYRSNRSHGDFLTKISLHVDRADRWWNAFESVLDDHFRMSYGARRTKRTCIFLRRKKRCSSNYAGELLINYYIKTPIISRHQTITPGRISTQH